MTKSPVADGTNAGRAGPRQDEGFVECRLTWCFGSGADRNRTDDLLLAKQVLYQLSYRPLEVEMLPQGPQSLESTAQKSQEWWWGVVCSASLPSGRSSKPCSRPHRFWAGGHWGPSSSFGVRLFRSRVR